MMIASLIDLYSKTEYVLYSGDRCNSLPAVQPASLMADSLKLRSRQLKSGWKEQNMV